jgi:hypothetical protein
MTTYSQRSRDGQPYDFPQGFSLGGVSLDADDSTRSIGLQVPGQDATTLYTWLVQTRQRLSAAQQTLPFATQQQITEGVSNALLISPASLKQALASLIGVAPVALDSLAEFAAAIGNDPNLSTTVDSQLAQKLSLLGSTATGLAETPTPTTNLNKAQAINIEYLLAKIDEALLSLKALPSAPTLDGLSLALIGQTYTLNMSATAGSGLTIASFNVLINGGNLQTVAATNGAGVLQWTVVGTENQTLTFSVVAVDNRGRTGPSATLQATATATAIYTPTFVSPAQDNQGGLSPHLTIETSAFSSPFVSQTHAATDWAIINVSTGQVDWQALADTANLTTRAIPRTYLKNATQYTITVRYISASGQTSSWGTLHFGTAASQAAPSSVAGFGYALPGENYAATVTAVASTALDTTIESYYYSVDNGVTKLPNLLGSVNNVIAAGSDLTGLSGTIDILFYVYRNYSGFSLPVAKSVVVGQTTAGAFLFPTEGLTGVSQHPTFTVSSYTSNIPTDSHLSSTWTVTDVASNEVIDEIHNSVSAKNAWSPVGLTAGTQYRVSCIQHGTIFVGLPAVTVTCTTTTTPEAYLPSQVISTTSENNAQMGFSLSTNQDGSLFVAGIPAATMYTFSTPHTNSGAVDFINTALATSIRTMYGLSTDINTPIIYTGLASGMNVFGNVMVYNTRLPNIVIAGRNSSGTMVSTSDVLNSAITTGADGLAFVKGFAQTDMGIDFAVSSAAGIQWFQNSSLAATTRPFLLSSTIPQDPLGLGMSLQSYGDSLSISGDGNRLAVSLRWGINTNVASLVGFAVYDYNSTNNTWSSPVIKTGIVMGAWNLPTEFSASNWMQMSRDGKVIALGNPCKLSNNTGKGAIQFWVSDRGSDLSGETWTLQQTLEDARGDAIDGGMFGYSLALSSNGSVLVAACAGYLNDNGCGRVDLLLRTTPTSQSWRQKNYSMVPTAINPAELTNAHVGSALTISADGRVAMASHLKYNAGCGAALVWNLPSSMITPYRDAGLDSIPSNTTEVNNFVTRVSQI